MQTEIRKVFLFITLISGLALTTVNADSMSTGVERQLIAAEALANVPGYKLTAVTVVIEPGVVSPAHRHGGFVFVYVLEGTVRSQLNDGDVVEFKAGQSWVEPPGTLHSLAQNPSDTEKAKILVVFIAKEDETLTTVEK